YGPYDSSAAYHTLTYITASPSTHGMWVNGARATVLQTSAVGNFNLTTLCLGNQLIANAGPGNGYLDGEIAEVLIYNSDQSANQTTIETYLSNKWQIVSSST